MRKTGRLNAFPSITYLIQDSNPGYPATEAMPIATVLPQAFAWEEPRIYLFHKQKFFVSPSIFENIDTLYLLSFLMSICICEPWSWYSWLLAVFFQQAHWYSGAMPSPMNALRRNCMPPGLTTGSLRQEDGCIWTGALCRLLSLDMPSFLSQLPLSSMLPKFPFPGARACHGRYLGGIWFLKRVFKKDVQKNTILLA